MFFLIWGFLPPEGRRADSATLFADLTDMVDFFDSLQSGSAQVNELCTRWVNFACTSAASVRQHPVWAHVTTHLQQPLACCPFALPCRGYCCNHHA